MKLYTKTGDKGETGLFGGARVSKASARVDAYGTIDELNAVLGLARSTPLDASIDSVLSRVQSELFVLGSELACVSGKESKLGIALIDDSHARALEADIDASETNLPPLKSFILPGGTPSASALHHARTVCRRAERAVISLSHTEALRPEVVIYLNRLSDLCFSLARRANHLAGVEDVPWHPR